MVTVCGGVVLMLMLMLTLLLSLVVTSRLLLLLKICLCHDESVHSDEIMKIGVELTHKTVKYVSQIELQALSDYLLCRRYTHTAFYAGTPSLFHHAIQCTCFGFHSTLFFY